MSAFTDGFEKRASFRDMRSGRKTDEPVTTPGVGMQPKTTPLPLPTYSRQHPKSNLKPSLPPKAVS
jgi:hypothetical protein